MQAAILGGIAHIRLAQLVGMLGRMSTEFRKSGWRSDDTYRTKATCDNTDTTTSYAAESSLKRPPLRICPRTIGQVLINKINVNAVTLDNLVIILWSISRGAGCNHSVSG